IEIQAKLQRTVAFSPAVDSLDFLADEAEFRGVLQANVRRHWPPRRVASEFRVGGRTTAWPMDHARFGAALIGRRVPSFGGRGDEHRARLCSEFPVLLERMRDRT